MRAERRIDSKGRITIPKALREQLAIEPGEPVEVTVENGRVVIQRRSDSEASIGSLRGCITDANKRSDTVDIDPLELKHEWEPDRAE